MDNIKFTHFEHGLGIEVEDQKFVLLYEESKRMTWDAAIKWAAERNADLPTPMQDIILWDYLDEINGELAALDKPLIIKQSSLPTDRTYRLDPRDADGISMNGGGVVWGYEGNYYPARVDSAFNTNFSV